MDKNNDIQISAIDDRIDAFIRGMMTEEEEAQKRKRLLLSKRLRQTQNYVIMLWLQFP